MNATPLPIKYFNLAVLISVLICIPAYGIDYLDYMYCPVPSTWNVYETPILLVSFALFNASFIFMAIVMYKHGVSIRAVPKLIKLFAWIACLQCERLVRHVRTVVKLSLLKARTALKK